ncbi:MAG: heavy metal translocating P-type ATPase [Thermaurantimonas sp.]|uniref:heavy metal translocating P-type ATPase n=1 Tax=Thermaurantimonas sp. TaxID=2681568 RepID=UPI00391D9DCA
MAEICFHCGEPIDKERVEYDGKAFCCHGCKEVYHILKENALEDFYKLNPSSGVSKKREAQNKDFSYLDNPEIADKILQFREGGVAVVRWSLPQIHCSSCIWLLENLPKLKKGVLSVVVNFPKRTAQITFRESDISLAGLAALLDHIGYPPALSQSSLTEGRKEEKSFDRTLIYQLAVAGFAFGNIMLLSIPEYLGMNNMGDENYAYYFRFVSMALSLPVLLYSSQEYYKSAWAGLRSGVINIDVPIVLGIFIIFFRSLYEVFVLHEPGFFDSLAGLLFFLLIGKYFQRRTYERMSFDRDYSFYFPIAVTRILADGSKEQIPISKIAKDDLLLIHSDELIPVDAELVEGRAYIDNSFVTGEAIPVSKNPGDRIYAGGRQKGEKIVIKALKPLDQSYLTSIWNQPNHRKGIKIIKDLTDKISKRFTIWLLAVAFLGFLAWLPFNAHTAINVLTAVLIVACPCALALAAPFAESNMMLHLGRNGLYLKDAPTVEQLADVEHFVFDKTGTLTVASEGEVTYQGMPLTDEEVVLVHAVVSNSLHPLSRILSKSLHTGNAEITEFSEEKGSGLRGVVNGNVLKIGSRNFVIPDSVHSTDEVQNSEVHIEINGQYRGCYTIQNKYRENLHQLFESLKDKPITILSGDNDRELPNLKKFLPETAEIRFFQKPTDKLQYIEDLESKGIKTLMAGDGLNDAGALMRSHMGISVAEDVYTFSPACDAILEASHLHKLPKYVKAAKSTVKIIKESFLISLLYNIGGLSFALAGMLEPIVCAILMPISSISVVVYVVLRTQAVAKSIFTSSINHQDTVSYQPIKREAHLEGVR